MRDPVLKTASENAASGPVGRDYFRLLKEWLDALLSFTLSFPASPALDGAVLCPACAIVHGRCHEAAYPLLAMADYSGEEKYLEAARKLFRWSARLLCDDGSMYNDLQSAWNGTTVFSALSLAKALSHHGHLLTAEEKSAWEERLLTLVRWLRESITPKRRFNINYIAANAAAMALAGRYFGDEEMLALGKQLADFSLRHVSENGLVYGEGSPERNATPRGGCAVDTSYNVEETLPSLYDYAAAAEDEDAMAAVREAARAHLDLMLPDGAWDNSFGSRNFKWTYWGGRTSDGCQAMLNGLGKTESVFAEAAYRNLLLLRRCTRGLLYGGPHYMRHGENPCVHHAFCHAKALAQALDEGVAEFRRVPLPSDDPEPVKRYPEIETLRLARGPWRMTVCAGDFPYMQGGHASGGAITLLWHRVIGPILATGNTDFSLREAHNQQQTLKKALQGSLCPRLEKTEGGTVYSQVYDFSAAADALSFPDRTAVRVSGVLCGISHEPSPGGESYALEYTLRDEGLSVKGRIAGGGEGAAFILPVVCPADRPPVLSGQSALIGGCLRVSSAGPIECKGPVFALSPGFEAADLYIRPDGEGNIDFTIAAEDPDSGRPSPGPDGVPVNGKERMP